MDDLKASHKDSKVIDEFIEWLEEKYGDAKIGHVKSHRGKEHDYLAMKLDYKTKGKVKTDMRYYVDNMLENFPMDFKQSDKVATPANDNLFTVDNSPKLNDERKGIFHTFVAKGLFLSK